MARPDVQYEVPFALFRDALSGTATWTDQPGAFDPTARALVTLGDAFVVTRYEQRFTP
jgi:hypothetical protein